MPKGLAPHFQKSLEYRWSMRFKTRHPDGDNYDGVVIHVGRDFIVLREEAGLEFDGMILLRKSAIRGVRDGKFEVCTNAILQQNGMIERLKVPVWVTKCATIQDFVTALMKRSIWPGIETLFGDGLPAFYLGPIESVSEYGFVTKCYDATGKWEKARSLPWNEIFRIEVGSSYCNHFNRYMQSKAPASSAP